MRMSPKMPVARFSVERALAGILALALCTAIARSASDVVVTFASVIGKTYRIESKDDLSAANWTLVQDQLVATNTSTPITNPGARCSRTVKPPSTA